MSAPTSPLMRELSNYMANAWKRKLPSEVVERTKIHLVDAFAAMISGSRLLPGKRAIAYIKQFSGTGEASVVGSRVVTSTLLAALANGICAQADETDDVHLPSRMHAGACVIPPALAMAERCQSSGASLLRAIVLGYDISTRVVLAAKHAQFAQTGFHPSSKGGVFGAAAAAGLLLKLDAQKMRYMLSYCAEQAAGLMATILRDPQHNEKAYVTGGMPAHNGIAAAQMVASGFTGVEDALFGEGNFLSVFSDDADPDALTGGLGRDYEILRASIKYWPVAGPVQAALHVLRDLMRQYEFKAGDVDKLTVRMPDTALKAVDNRDMPDISLQHLLAVMLVDGAITFETAHDFARVKDPLVRKLRRDRIATIGDAGLRTPLRRWCCVMEVELKDGRKLNHQTMSTKGDFENPLTREEEGEKALDLMGPIFGKKRSLALMAALFDIERSANVRSLRKLYMI